MTLRPNLPEAPMLTRRAALLLSLTALAACGTRPEPEVSHAALHPGETPELRALIRKWAATYEIPESLLHRQIQRESGYNPGARNGPYYGLLQIQVQTARAEEAMLAWQKAVLVAVQEVENSLLVRSQEAERGAALTLTAEHRRRSLLRAESLRREGQIDLLVLLDVQRSVLASELALSDSRLQQALADVQLYKALGGGYAPAPRPLASRTSP